MAKNLPVNKESPLIKIPKFVPSAGFLGGKQGNEINKEIQSKYKSNSALQIANYDDGIIKGSNDFYVVAVNEILRSQGYDGIKTATPADVQEVLNTNALNLRGSYEDLALVLNSSEGTNQYLAKNLLKQIKQRTGKDRAFPMMIPLNGLELKVDQDSEHGLAFNLTDNSEIIYAPQLKGKNSGRNFSNTNENGIPIFNKDGNRTLYTRSDGLSRLGVNDDLSLNSDWNGLANSDSDGRVVLISGEATDAQNFKDKAFKEAEKRRDAGIADAEKRYNKSIKDINKNFN